MVTVSTLVSGMTSAVMRLGALKSAKSKKFWLLRRYLRESNVPTPLAVRIYNYCDFAWEASQNVVQEDKVELLALLTTSLRAELRTTIYQQTIEHHPLFLLVGKIAHVALQLLCNTAISKVNSGRGDHLFRKADYAESMYFFLSGELRYYYLDIQPHPVDLTIRVAEAALWTRWTHKGTLQARKECSVVTINSHFFAEAMRSHRDAWLETSDYARSFVSGMSKPSVTKLTDLYQSPCLEGLWFRLMREFKISSHYSQSARQRFGSVGRMGSFFTGMHRKSKGDRNSLESM